MNHKLFAFCLSLAIFNNINLNASELSKVHKDAKYNKRVEKIALALDPDWEDLPENDAINILDKAINSGIDVNDINSGYLLSNAIYSNEHRLACFLIQNGADVTKYEPLQHVSTLPLAKLMIEKKVNVKFGLLYAAQKVNLKLALLYYKYGALPSTLDEKDYTPYIFSKNKQGYSALMHLLSAEGNHSIDSLLEFVSVLVKLHVPLDIKPARNGDDYLAVLNANINQNYVKRFNKTISSAVKENALTALNRKTNLPSELTKHFIKEISNIILAYDDPTDKIVSYEILKELDTVEAEANCELAKILKQEKERIANSKGCTIL